MLTPRIIALVISLPLLTILADMFGLIGGGLVAKQIHGLDTNIYIQSVRAGVAMSDLIGGLVKPLAFGLIIALVSCYKGLSTTGGTVGVGRSTTNAVVLASINIIIADFFLSKILQSLFKSTMF